MDERIGKLKYKKWVKVLLLVKKKMIVLQWQVFGKVCIQIKIKC